MNTNSMTVVMFSKNTLIYASQNIFDMYYFSVICVWFQVCAHLLFVQLIVEMFKNLTSFILQKSYFTELSALIAYISAISQPNALTFSGLLHNIAPHNYYNREIDKILFNVLKQIFNEIMRKITKVIIKISHLTCRLYVSYAYTKLQWIGPVHYADVAFQLMPLKFKMSSPITV